MEILSTSNVRSRVVRPYWFRLYAFDYGSFLSTEIALFWMKRGHSIATRCIHFAHDVSLNIGTPIKSDCLAWFLRDRLHRVGLDLLRHSGRVSSRFHPSCLPDCGICQWASFSTRRSGSISGERPTLAQWRTTFITGCLLLAVGNGTVSWAEKTIPSGIAALLVATVSLWMVLLDWVRPGGVRPVPRVDRWLPPRVCRDGSPDRTKAFRRLSSG